MIKIRGIIARENGYAIARLWHGGNELTAKVRDEGNVLENTPMGKELSAEMDYGELLGMRALQHFEDKDSEVLQRGADFIIKGRIILIIRVGNEFIINIYIQNGADFICVTQPAEECEGMESGDGVEITISDLRFFPVSY